MSSPGVRRLLIQAGCLSLVLVSCAATTWAQQKPNVIVLLADDAGFSDFGFMNQFTGGTTQFKTPNLDALAAGSRVMSNGYAAASVCSVSRAGLLTGRYPQRFGFDYNVSNADDPNDGIPTSELLMTEAMKSAGYHTGVFGKWHVGAELAKQPQNQGVDEFYGILAGSRPYFNTGGVPVLRNTTAIQWQNEASFNNIAPDPVKGRLFTDALGDEASKFVANNANQANPFFMYVPFTAPHSPYEDAKAQDLAQFDSTSLTGLRKNVAANTFALDRAVGNILARVNDPDGNPNTNDSIAGNTIIVFYNDNGGAQPSVAETNLETVHDNTPLYNWKGTQWEGGVRVPMMVKLPGGTTGVFNTPTSALDLMPTFLAAAGAPIPSNIDGKNLAPYLSGAQSGPIHDAMIFRQGFNGWAIREGDWKLVHGNQNAGFQLRKLAANGTGEEPGAASYNSSEPVIYRQLINDYVDWEATVSKPYATTNYALNRFDAFRLRQDLASGSTPLNWRDGAVWVNDASPSTIVTMMREDSYANAALVFSPRNDASYITNNNISRTAGLAYVHLDAPEFAVNPDGLSEFMMNELRFDGQFAGAASQAGTLQGFPLMFTKSLTGVMPKIRLNTTSTVAGSFSFNVNMNVVMHDDLEITGNGTQPLTINGQIKDFETPRSLTKTGTSVVTFGGNNLYAGDTIVNGGTLRINGANAALANTSKLQIGSQGAVLLESGRIHTPVVDVALGGVFSFTGGILETPQVNGNLTNNGGVFRPGLSTAITNITGDFAQLAGTTTIEIGGTTAGTLYDRIVAGHSAMLGGALQVMLINPGGGTFAPSLGDTFEIIRAGDSLSGAFGSVSVPALTGGKKWALQYGGTSALLQVVSGLTADFDHNNMVDLNDLNTWMTGLGTSNLGDADGDGDTDGSDFLIWQRQVGTQLLSSSAALAVVPEPTSGWLLTMAFVSIARFCKTFRPPA